MSIVSLDSLMYSIGLQWEFKIKHRQRNEHLIWLKSIDRLAVQLTVIQSFDIQSHSRETKNSHYCLIGPLNAFLLSDDHSVGFFSSHSNQHVFHIIGFLLCLMHALREYWKENKHTKKRVLHTAWCEFVARVYIDLISFFFLFIYLFGCCCLFVRHFLFPLFYFIFVKHDFPLSYI